MKKGTLPLIGLVAATLSITACVQQLWEVTYPGPDGYHSQAFDLTVDSDTNIILFGSTRTANNEDSLFIAKYNSNGKILWDYSDPNFLNFRWPNKNYVMTDEDNRVFYAGTSMEYEVLLGLLDKNGQPLWKNVNNSSVNDFPYFLDLAITFNNQYLALTTLNGLESYSIEGEKLWQFPAEEDPVEEIDLDDFPLSTPPPAYHSGEVAVNSNNSIFVTFGESIYRLDASGNVEYNLTATELGVEAIWDIDVGGENIAVLGASDNLVSLHILDKDLNHLNSHQINSSLMAGYVNLTNSNQLCYAINSQLDQSTLTLGLLNENELIWETTNTGEFAYRDLIDVQAGNNNCQITTAESLELPIVSSYTRIYTPTGGLKDTITNQDFYSATSLAKGSNVYSAGISGEYDGSITEATLIKHNIR